jgi:hypothetical protein
VDELSFRGKERFRGVSWRGLAATGTGLLVEGAFAFFRLGFVWFCCRFGGTLAFVAACFGVAQRSMTTVGADGITISWGLGDRRTYPWHEIRWLYVWEGSAGHGTSLVAKMVLADGRERYLPAVAASSVYPSPDFHADFQRVVRWWEAATAPSERFRPPARRRVSPQAWGMILGVVITVGVVLGVVVAGT